METIDIIIAVSDQENGKLGVGEREVIANLLEAQLMSQEDPLLGKDCSAFEFVNFCGAVPRRWKTAGWSGLGVSITA